AVPPLLVFDGLTVQGIASAVLACGIAAVAIAMRPGEVSFMLQSMRMPLLLAAIPIAWMLLQILPLKMIGLANPVWYTAEQALGHRLGGSISIDPGATALVCAQWLLALAVMLLAAAVGVDRQRAEWVLFALVAGTALAAALLILQDLTGVGLIS